MATDRFRDDNSPELGGDQAPSTTRLTHHLILDRDPGPAADNTGRGEFGA